MVGAQVPEAKSPEVPKAAIEAKAPVTEVGPSWAQQATVSISIEEAALKVEDSKSHSHYELDRLNLKTGSLSLDSLPMFKLSGILGALTEGQGEITGPFEINGESKDKALNLSANFDKVSLALGAFQKRVVLPLAFACPLKRRTIPTWLKVS